MPLARTDVQWYREIDGGSGVELAPVDDEVEVVDGFAVFLD